MIIKYDKIWGIERSSIRWLDILQSNIGYQKPLLYNRVIYYSCFKTETILRGGAFFFLYFFLEKKKKEI